MRPDLKIGAREQRFLSIDGGTRADDGERPSIHGYGALFKTEAVIAGMFRERIEPGAFAESLSTDNIRVAFNHDADNLFGTTRAKTATVEEDTRGLKYFALVPETTRARDAYALIKRGDVDGSSFQFSIERDEDEAWDFSPTKDGQLPIRTIKRARLFEVGPVTFPAYEQTTVSARAAAHLDEAQAAVAAAEQTASQTAAVPEGVQPTVTISADPDDIEAIEADIKRLGAEFFRSS